MRRHIGKLTIITNPGLTIRLGQYEAFASRVPEPARLDYWLAHGALFVRLGRYELVANRLRPEELSAFAGV